MKDLSLEKQCRRGGFQALLALVALLQTYRTGKMFDSDQPVSDASTPALLRREDDLEKRLLKGVYILFGDGLRICIGRGFALMEAVLLLQP